MKTEDWLKESDTIVIECQEDSVNEYTLVEVMPFDTKTNELLIDHKEIMLLKEALKINKRQIAKGNKLIEYLRSRLGKRIFD
jgi:hypothetical protein